VKFLHTSDWHVGKTLKGRSRHDEHKAVLAEIVGHARAHDVDAVLVSGDVYDSTSPGAEAQALVVRTLMTLAGDAIEVVAIAGNHDHGPTFEAYRPLMRAARITLTGQARALDKQGVHSFVARTTGETVNVATVPFLSQRYAVRAAQVIAPGDNVPARNVGAYDQWVRNIVDHLAGGFHDDQVNTLMAHLTCTGGAFGGGERAAQSIFEYHVPGGIFPEHSHYVALGHLHRRQRIDAVAPVHYSGAPLPVDFGEQDNTPAVVLVEATPGRPAEIRDIELTAGRRLRTVEGTLEELEARAASGAFGDDWLRVRIKEQQSAGLRDRVLDLLPHALEIHLHESVVPTRSGGVSASQVAARTPAELFADYCGESGVADDRVNALFDELHDELSRTS
jgi:exonuclease SbcD